LATIFSSQPDPAGVLPFVTGGLALLLVLSRSPWRWARTVVTIVHEAGHAVVALLAGRRLQSIRLHSDTSGVTASRGKPTGPGMIFTALAGYPAPSLLGLAFAALLAANRITVVLIVAAVLLLAVLVVVRNVYGVFAVVASSAVLGVVAFVATPSVQAWFVYAVTWFLLFGGVRPLFELQRKRYRGSANASDIDQLGWLTGTPPILWLLIIGVFTVGCLVLGGLWLLEPALNSMLNGPTL